MSRKTGWDVSDTDVLLVLFIAGMAIWSFLL